MTHNLDLISASNWNLAYTNNVLATIVGVQNGSNIYAKITPIIVSTVFDKSIISVAISTAIPTGRRWAYAGILQRFTNSYFGNIFIGESNRLLIGRNLTIFDDYLGDYQLQISVPGWFNSVNISIYQYEGDTRTVSQQDLEAIKAAVIPS